MVDAHVTGTSHEYRHTLVLFLSVNPATYTLKIPDAFLAAVSNSVVLFVLSSLVIGSPYGLVKKTKYYGVFQRIQV